jgi:heat shock protein HslJ
MRSRLAVTFLTLMLAAALLSAAGCGGSSSAASLDGTSWRLTGWTLSSLDPASFTITAKFVGGQISGSSAVNTYSGPYKAGPGEAFSVGDLASTMMGGPEPAMRAEKAYLTLLAQAKSYKLDGATLTLFDQSGNQSLLFASQTL